MANIQDMTPEELCDWIAVDAGWQLCTDGWYHGELELLSVYHPVKVTFSSAASMLPGKWRVQLAARSRAATAGERTLWGGCAFRLTEPVLQGTADDMVFQPFDATCAATAYLRLVAMARMAERGGVA